MSKTGSRDQMWPPLSADAGRGGDRQLLERFIAHRDETAFASLVERHGKSVWGVCRRVLGEQDAEDAFQAVFLVLARKATSIRRGEAVGSWLYGVAHRVAIRAKQNAARRREREQKQPEPRPDTTPPGEAACRELQRILDEEVQRLKEKYRAPFVLCCLEGMSKAEAAKELGCKEGTISGRLARARKFLQTRLARRGFTLSAALTAFVLANQATWAAAPAALMQSTAPAVLAGDGSLPASAVTLADDYLRTLWTGQLSAATGIVVALILLIVGLGAIALHFSAGSGNDMAIVEPESFVPPGVPLGTPIGEQVLTVAFTPDGKHLVTAGAWSDLPGQIKIWAIASGAETAAITRIPGVRAAVFSPDGNSLATGDGDGVITLRDPNSALERRSVKAHDGSVTAMAYSKDGDLLASTGLDRTVKLWTARDLVSKKIFAGHTDQVTSVAFFRTRRAIVTGSRDRTAKIWDIDTGKAITTLEVHGSSIHAVATSPDDRLVVTASADATVRLWDAETGAELAVLDGEKGKDLLSVAFSPDGIHLAAGGRDGIIRVWEVKTRRLVGTLEKHTGPIWALAFSRDGVLASGSGDKTAKLWHLGNGKQPKTFSTTWSGIRPIRTAVYSPDGKVLAVATADNAVHIRDAKTGDIVTVLRGHTAPVNCLAFAADGSTLASGGDDGTVKFWDWTAGEETHSMAGRAAVYALVFTPDSRKLASAGADETVRIREVGTGKDLATLKGHKGPIRALAISADGQTLASGGDDRLIRIWDVANAEEIRSLNGHRGAVRALAFSHAGLLASGSDDGAVKLWDPITGAERFTLSGHTKGVRAVTFSAKGQTLVSGSQDATIRVWDVATGQPRAVLKGHKDAVTAVTIHPHGHSLVSGSLDTVLLRWRAGDVGAGLNAPPAPGRNEVPVVFQEIRKDEKIPKAKNVTYHQSLKGALPTNAGLQLTGPDAEKLVKFEPEGMRITLAAGHMGERQITGLASNFGVRGDFEITVNYEILQEQAEDANPVGARVTLGLVLKKENNNLANFTRKFNMRSGPHYVAWTNALEKPTSKHLLTKAKIGRLRLTRTGNVVSYHFGDGPDGKFTLWQEFPIGAEDVHEVRLTANTGSDKAAVDVRLTDLRISAAALVKAPPPPPPPPPPTPPSTPPVLPERVEFSFRDGIGPDAQIRLSGPHPEGFVKTDAQGLRITVPAHRDDRNEIGVESLLRLRGDFEITLQYNLLALPDPPPELGAGPVLSMYLDTPDQFRVRLTRTRKPNGAVFGASFITIGTDGKEIFSGLNFPRANDKESKGALRLVRIGKKLSFQVSEGAAGFRTIASRDVGTADVTSVRALCGTGWRGKFDIDIRYTSLELRAEQMPNKSAPPAPDGGDGPDILQGAGKSRTWLLAAVIILGVIATLLAGGVGLSFVLAKRRVTEAKTNGKPDKAVLDNASGSESPPISTVCGGCRAKLRFKATSAGKKLKCPKCGHAVLVPHASGNKVNQASRQED